MEEIETVLINHLEVKEGIVVIQGEEEEQKQLVSYIIPKKSLLEEEGDLEENIRGYLKEKLPLYMIPNTFVILESFPLTPNGKIDRKALASLEQDSKIKRKAYVAPRNTTEEQLAAMWSSLLNIEKVSIHDNFFNLGGHSLIATQAISRIRSTCNVDISLRALFEHPTIAALSKVIDSLSNKKFFLLLLLFCLSKEKVLYLFLLHSNDFGFKSTLTRRCTLQYSVYFKIKRNTKHGCA